MDSRIAILGANGAGKSTLLGILVEKLKLTEGEYYKNARMRISLFT
jgi:ATP-binding cassette subfamily F protein 3